MAAKIILADDDPIMRDMAQAKLVEAGYMVEIAENGSEAFSILRKSGADLVISDLEMPVMSGFELTERIRADSKLAATPLIVITASDDPRAVDRAFAAGATSFLAKPINWSLFDQAVKFVLRASDDQRALRVARDQAEAGLKFKDSLMSVMSHELRTPLNAIIGFGQILGEHFNKAGDETNQEYAEYIIESGKRLLGSVSDMLLASDARSGPIKLNEIDTTVGDIVEEMRSLCEMVCAGANAELKILVQDPELEVCCDRTLIAKALAKLVDNSVKFSNSGLKVTVGVALNKAGDLIFLVKDNGPGIEKEKLKLVTAPFTQSDMSIRRSREGLGLGIPLAQAITSSHGGVFRLACPDSGGAEAVIGLPASRVNPIRSSARSRQVA